MDVTFLMLILVTNDDTAAIFCMKYRESKNNPFILKEEEKFFVKFSIAPIFRFSSIF